MQLSDYSKIVGLLMVISGIFSTLSVLLVLTPYLLKATVEATSPGGFATLIPVIHTDAGVIAIICAAWMLIFSILLIIFGFKKYALHRNVQLSDYNKTIGLLAIIVGITEIIATMALIAVQFYFISSPGFPTPYNVAMAAVLRAIGPLALGIMIFFFGLKARKGLNDKIVILSELFRVFGVAGVITGVCSIVFVIMQNNPWTSFVIPLVTLMAGLIFVWVSSKIATCNKNAVGKILWATLLIFILVLIALLSTNLYATFDIFARVDYALAGYIFAFSVTNLCVLYVHICMFVTLLLPEVRELMGIQKEQNTGP